MPVHYRTRFPLGVEMSKVALRIAGGFMLMAVAAVAQEAVTSLLEKARAAYDARADAAQAAAAVEGFGVAAAANLGSYEARWEGARASYFLGAVTREQADDDERIAIFADGIERAKAAIALRPDGVEGHFWLGVLLSSWGEARGVLKSLSVVPDIRREMELCVAKEPSVEGWGPDRVLGRVYYKLPFFKGGDNKKSREHLERSLAGAPTNALTRLYLADTYKSMGEKAKAIEQLRAVLAMTPDPRWVAEHPGIRVKAEALLRKLE
jgi:tetratricopeptide (TPR) repeat protein